MMNIRSIYVETVTTVPRGTVDLCTSNSPRLRIDMGHLYLIACVFLHSVHVSGYYIIRPAAETSTAAGPLVPNVMALAAASFPDTGSKPTTSVSRALNTDTVLKSLGLLHAFLDKHFTSLNSRIQTLSKSIHDVNQKVTEIKIKGKQPGAGANTFPESSSHSPIMPSGQTPGKPHSSPISNSGASSSIPTDGITSGSGHLTPQDVPPGTKEATLQGIGQTAVSPILDTPALLQTPKTPQTQANSQKGPSVSEKAPGAALTVTSTYVPPTNVNSELGPGQWYPGSPPKIAHDVGSKLNNTPISPQKSADRNNVIKSQALQIGGQGIIPENHPLPSGQQSVVSKQSNVYSATGKKASPKNQHQISPTGQQNDITTTHKPLPTTQPEVISSTVQSQQSSSSQQSSNSSPKPIYPSVDQNVLTTTPTPNSNPVPQKHVPSSSQSPSQSPSPPTSPSPSPPSPSPSPSPSSSSSPSPSPSPSSSSSSSPSPSSGNHNSTGESTTQQGGAANAGTKTSLVVKTETTIPPQVVQDVYPYNELSPQYTSGSKMSPQIDFASYNYYQNLYNMYQQYAYRLNPSLGRNAPLSGPIFDQWMHSMTAGGRGMSPYINPSMPPYMNPGMPPYMNPGMPPYMNPGMPPHMGPGMNSGNMPHTPPGGKPNSNQNQKWSSTPMPTYSPAQRQAAARQQELYNEWLSELYGMK